MKIHILCLEQTGEVVTIQIVDKIVQNYDDEDRASIAASRGKNCIHRL